MQETPGSVHIFFARSNLWARVDQRLMVLNLAKVNALTQGVIRYVHPLQDHKSSRGHI